MYFFFKLLLLCLILKVSKLNEAPDFNGDNNDNNSTLEKENQIESILETINDVEQLASFVLMRSHIIIDPTHKIRIDETKMEKVLDYLDETLNRMSNPATEDRDLGCEYISDNHAKELCEVVTSDCLSSNEMLDLLPQGLVKFEQQMARLCPLILFRQTRPICHDGYEPNGNEEEEKLKFVEPPIEKVWAFSMLFATLSIVVSMGGLIAIPFLKRDARRTILTLFEGLAVGGLAGSAILHLFPQAFDIIDDKYRVYFWKISLIFLGMYFFYCFELAVKVYTAIKYKGKRKRTASLRQEDNAVLGLPLVNYKSHDENDRVGHYEQTRLKRSNSLPENQALLNSTREQLFQCLSTIKIPTPISSTRKLYSSQTINKIHEGPSKQTYVIGVALKRQDQNSNPSTVPIDSVAWMIVLGDALLNFIDGLSIGAAFDRNILAGISISVAVMLEEVTHRLGTFAVLIRAGMKMKQSFLYIFLSACACYPGLVVGVILGDEAEEASPYIFALAGKYTNFQK